MFKKVILFFWFPLLCLFSLFGFDVDVYVDTESDRGAISLYIYGCNQYLSDTENWANVRMGGNRMTGYNWENNASNTGKDYNHSSDDFVSSWMEVPGSNRNTPGAAIDDSSNTRLHLILINKDLENAMNVNLILASTVKYTTGSVRGFDSTSSSLRQFTGINIIVNNRITYSLPEASIVHIILQSDGSAAPQLVPATPPTPVPALFESKVSLEYQ